MRRFKPTLYLGFLILLSGCASTKTNYYTQTVQSWHGGNVNALIKRWGIPDDRLKSPRGNIVYVYKTESYRGDSAPMSPAVGVSFTPGGTPIMTTGPNLNNTWNRGMSLACITAFETDANGKIISAQAQGPGCYASEALAAKMRNPG